VSVIASSRGPRAGIPINTTARLLATREVVAAAIETRVSEKEVLALRARTIARGAREAARARRIHGARETAVATVEEPTDNLAKGVVSARIARDASRRRRRVRIGVARRGAVLQRFVLHRRPRARERERSPEDNRRSPQATTAPRTSHDATSLGGRVTNGLSRFTS